MRTQFEYAALPLAYVLGRSCAVGLNVKPDGSYLASDREGVQFDRLLAAGFRWTRSEGDLAIFERQFEAPPPGAPGDTSEMVAARDGFWHLRRAIIRLQYAYAKNKDATLGDAIEHLGDVVSDIQEIGEEVFR